MAENPPAGQDPPIRQLPSYSRVLQSKEKAPPVERKKPDICVLQGYMHIRYDEANFENVVTDFPIVDKRVPTKAVLPFVKAKHKLPNETGSQNVMLGLYTDQERAISYFKDLMKCKHKYVLHPWGIFYDDTSKRSVISFRKVTCSLRDFISWLADHSPSGSTYNIPGVKGSYDIPVIHILRRIGKALTSIHTQKEAHGELTIDSIFLLLDFKLSVDSVDFAEPILCMQSHVSGETRSIEDKVSDFMDLGTVSDEVAELLTISENEEIKKYIKNLRDGQITCYEELAMEPGAWLPEEKISFLLTLFESMTLDQFDGYGHLYECNFPKEGCWLEKFHQFIEAMPLSDDQKKNRKEKSQIYKDSCSSFTLGCRNSVDHYYRDNMGKVREWFAVTISDGSTVTNREICLLTFQGYYPLIFYDWIHNAAQEDASKDVLKTFTTKMSKS